MARAINRLIGFHHRSVGTASRTKPPHFQATPITSAASASKGEQVQDDAPGGLERAHIAGEERSEPSRHSIPSSQAWSASRSCGTRSNTGARMNSTKTCLEGSPPPGAAARQRIASARAAAIRITRRDSCAEGVAGGVASYGQACSRGPDPEAPGAPGDGTRQPGHAEKGSGSQMDKMKYRMPITRSWVVEAAETGKIATLITTSSNPPQMQVHRSGAGGCAPAGQVLTRFNFPHTINAKEPSPGSSIRLIRNSASARRPGAGGHHVAGGSGRSICMCSLSRPSAPEGGGDHPSEPSATSGSSVGLSTMPTRHAATRSHTVQPMSSAMERNKRVLADLFEVAVLEQAQPGWRWPPGAWPGQARRRFRRSAPPLPARGGGSRSAG